MKSLFRFSVLIALLLSACVAAPASTNTPRPTMAPPTRTPRPRSTPTPRPTIHACVTNSTIRIRKGPGTNFEAIGGMVSGTCMSIQGRNKDSSWVYIVSEDNKTGWVKASLLTIEGNLRQVAVRSDSISGADAAPISNDATLQAIANLAKTYVAEHSTTTTTPNPLSAFGPTRTPKPIIDSFVPCADVAAGRSVSCKITRAYCDYRPDADGNPTFCNDRPYPNHNFTMVVWGADWSQLDGSCIVVSGYVELYRGKPQIEAVSSSQVSYCD